MISVLQFGSITLSSTAISNITLISVVALLLIWRRGRLRGTTLIGPWAWAMIALLGLITAELVLLNVSDEQHDAFAAAVRFVAACGTICPVMSLLGAKRPQHSGWHFVVLTLWAVLVLPSFEVMFLHRGQTLEIHAMRGWFLWGLIGLEVINLLPTRFWLSAIFFTVSQSVLLADQLPLIAFAEDVPKETIGLIGILSALLLASINIPRRATIHPYDKLWFDFRDSFGSLWALRFAERMNTAAQMNDWPIVLGWSGYLNRDDYSRIENLPPELAAPMEQAMVNLLRRFVSPEWISQRLGKSSEP